MEQNRLLNEYAEDALTDLVKALGGPKAVGHKLMPDLALDDARRQVDGWCDRESKYKPSLSQLVWLISEGRRVGCHSLMHFLADECGYEKPEPVDPKDEEAELERAFIDAVDRLENIKKDLDRRRARGLRGVA